MALQSINPANGVRFAEYRELTAGEIEEKIACAREAYQSWRTTSLDERAKLFRRTAQLLRDRSPRYGKLITDEMGKTIGSAEGEVSKCGGICEYFADNGAAFLTPEAVTTEARESFVRFDPIGTVLAVMPWNMPFWMPMRSLVPAIMAGNVMLLKHASNVCGCALALEELLLDAGFPRGVFQSLLIGASKVGAIIDDPRVAAVTLTGSEAAGVDVSRRAAAQVKKSVLELGGSDPFIVLADADVGKAATVGLTARTYICGQACIAAKRFIVEAPVYDQFVELVSERMAALRVGDPLNRETQVGPLAKQDLVDDIDRQVKASIASGAVLKTGGKPVEGPGCFYELTVLANVTKGMAVYDEETFGPVIAVIRADDEDDAIAIANDTPYGLGASLWTGNTEKAKKLAARIEAGLVFVNDMVKSDPRMPFGGVKRSGFGRECGRYGMLEFVNIKSVVVA